jgi:hypothetical protein
MIMPEILLETSLGVIFEKTATKNRCKVAVKNKDGGHIHMVYRFKNGAEPISSPYISWENLNCCGGWHCDESYLLTAVQERKKLCAGITFNNEGDLTNYIGGLPGEYPYFCRPPMLNGARTFYYHYIDVVRKGAVADYIDDAAVFCVYGKLGITNFNRERLFDLLRTPMIRLIGGAFDYANPKTPEELITTGLLLGYPLESTAWLLEKG